MSFVLPNFEGLREYEFGKDPEHEGKKGGVVKFVGGTFKREKIVKKIFFVTMTEYQEGLPVDSIAFPKIVVNDTISEVIAKQGLYQLHMSESEKERFVNYYFNGQREAKFPRQESVIVASPKVATYDLKPEMSVNKIVEEFKINSNLGKYSFFVINFANADMVAHTGNIAAATRAVEHVDHAVGEMVNWTLALGGTMVITADHGNAEEMLSYPTTSFFITTEKGKINTDHSNNPVPIYIISPGLKNKAYTLRRGAAYDIAPTLLHIAGIKKPISMTGISLLEQINSH
jgi:2,3-bisphosphoglycerate-independent phosphoglycerate mutase